MDDLPLDGIIRKLAVRHNTRYNLMALRLSARGGSKMEEVDLKGSHRQGIDIPCF
jgi:hypothetical protein